MSMSSSTSGRDEDRGEGGVAAVARIERRLAHQAVHADLGAQPAVGVFALHLDGRALHAGDLAGLRVDQIGAEAARARPAQVHAQQHLRPVLRLGAAGAGLDVQEGVVRVHLAAEHALELEVAHACLESLGIGDRCPARRPHRSPPRPGPAAPPHRRCPWWSGRSRSTSALRRARSRPSSCARAGSDQTAGSSSSRLTSSRRSCLVSYSKKPPKGADALPKVFELALQQVDFHAIPRMVAAGLEAPDAITRRLSEWRAGGAR